MMSMIIDVAKVFSPFPFGRYLTDGQNSATRFREEVLKQALATTDDEIEINFSHVKIGVGSSFLEEAFGGLVREGFDADELKHRIKIVGGMAAYPSQVIRFVERAKSLGKKEGSL